MIAQTLPGYGSREKSALVYGIHVYGNLYGCDKELLKDEIYLTKVVREAAEVAGATVVSTFYYKFGVHGGVSVVAIVAESHISIHTWPEYGYATVDVYTCGSHTKPMEAFKYIVKNLKASRYEVFTSDRSYYVDGKVEGDTVS
ncbi:MAG: adenosylmethionine decarboxylase [Vulcanisaeta sp.]|nr:adenosylmethionine decarboxylase [Vulcanisaeta sp.]MCG2869190.1 adenosylmethionine decarboxylase [Vulcanisaeta sp.]MCG2887283.1 adenosylmethionine decarboxylase [Vulcanisaeta sp.]